MNALSWNIGSIALYVAQHLGLVLKNEEIPIWVKKPYFASSVQITLENTYFLTFSSPTLLPHPKYLLTMTLNHPQIHHSNKPELHTQHTATKIKGSAMALFLFVFSSLYEFELHVFKKQQFFLRFEPAVLKILIYQYYVKI